MPPVACRTDFFLPPAFLIIELEVKKGRRTSRVDELRDELRRTAHSEIVALKRKNVLKSGVSLYLAVAEDL